MILISNLHLFRLDLLSNTPLHQNGSRLDVLAKHLQTKLSYKKGERDMVVMHHLFDIEWPTKKETLHSSYVRYGDQKHSAMAYTVGTPCAIATQLILNKKIISRGVIAPLSKEIYEPLNSELYKEGIRFTEKVIRR